MILKSLKLESYRNYRQCDLSLSPGINILYGDNAQGKTNILEAIYLSATTKSHRGSKDKDIINFLNDESHIVTLWEKEGLSYRIDMHLRKAKSKGIAINGQTLKKASELLGLVNVVFFSPEDLSIIKNGPVERRRFIDMELSQIDKAYLYDLNQYNKTVNQRNMLLRTMAPQSNRGYSCESEVMDMLAVWNEQLVHYGKNIIRARKKFNEDINSIIKSIHDEISGGREKINVIYSPNTDEDDFEKNLSLSMERDIKYKMTNTGPHKDDLIFEINGVDVRKFGSQGQQRTVALSLKLAEIEMIKLKKKDAPLLLLDDVLSELDANRQNDLLSRIGDIQTIITCTGVEEFVKKRIKMDAVFNVKNGEIERNTL